MSKFLRLREQAISRKSENAAFACERCGIDVHPLCTGSYRNHCPSCLYSKHVDIRPGDRAATCGGLMAPIGVDFRSGKGFMLIHRCMSCGYRRLNRVATDDPRQPDDIAAVAAIGGGR